MPGTRGEAGGTAEMPSLEVEANREMGTVACTGPSRYLSAIDSQHTIEALPANVNNEWLTFPNQSMECSYSFHKFHIIQLVAHVCGSFSELRAPIKRVH